MRRTSGRMRKRRRRSKMEEREDEEDEWEDEKEEEEEQVEEKEEGKRRRRRMRRTSKRRKSKRRRRRMRRTRGGGRDKEDQKKTRDGERTIFQVATDSMMAMAWTGFGPEKGLYNFTVVTALVDIGRGSWGRQERGYSQYLLYMQRMLRLDVNMVIFVGAKGRPFIDWMRRGRGTRTYVVETSIQDLPYFRYRDRFKEIMESEQYQRDNDLVRKGLAEAVSPEYDIIQLSKFYFVDRAVQMNVFNTSYFIWLDAGYGKGANIHPKDGVWVPKNLFEYADQLTFIERGQGALYHEPKKEYLHKVSLNIIAGLFFGGGSEVVQEAYRRQQREVMRWVEEGIVDDDQTMYMLLYYQEPAMFHLVQGDWLEVFKLFNSHDS
ncbi:protein htrl-like [Plakobranchus ocellatus]|uniref:Protein htrl-like n=1 Tax=Plakobranchus ocellatus TaxID=259542 RepID=A0AAV3ZEL1_9GAST|nr:protein htrl-like [Plakobranchus ocellatus]